MNKQEYRKYKDPRLRSLTAKHQNRGQVVDNSIDVFLLPS